MNKDLILKTMRESLRVKERFFNKKNAALIESAAVLIADTFKCGGKLLIAGNGGSASDAQHIAAEFVNRFEIERPPLPAIALTTDTSIITSIANDYDYGQVFSKQLKAIGAEGDVLLAISTSGSSTNVVRASECAEKLGMKTIALSGQGGGKLAEKADILISVKSASTARVQEVHITVCHIICEVVDSLLFKKV